jgi:hypothetical protein
MTVRHYDDDRTTITAEFVSRRRLAVDGDPVYRIRLAGRDGDAVDVLVPAAQFGSVLGLRTGATYRFEGLRRSRSTVAPGDGDGGVGRASAVAGDAPPTTGAGTEATVLHVDEASAVARAD